jgi:hypothetical protein
MQQQKFYFIYFSAFLTSLCSLFFSIEKITAQNAMEESQMTGKITPKEFGIPASPVFDFMGVTPSQVVRSSDIKDFKVDWSFRSYRLSPNLAIQGQPVWELFFNKKSLSTYQDASAIMRKLATLDVSLGTVETETGDRRIGYGLKMNLLKQRDPLMMRDLYEDLELLEENQDAALRYAELKRKYDEASVTEQFELFEALQSAKTTLEEERRQGSSTARQNRDILMERVEKITRFLAYEYWNSYQLDIAFAQTASYSTNANGSLASLKINRNTGYGIWLNGGFGIGKRSYLSGLARFTKFDDQIDFQVLDPNSQQNQPESITVDNSIISLGLNYRYGSPAYTFFVEFLYERKDLPSAMAIIQDPSIGGFQGASVSGILWDATQPVIISIGGDWRVSKNVILNYGFRGTYTKTWTLQYVIPVVNISCMMR